MIKQCLPNCRLWQSTVAKKKKKECGTYNCCQPQNFCRSSLAFVENNIQKKKNVKARVFVARTAVVFPLAGFVLLATMQFQFKLLLFCTFHLNNFCDLFLF